MKHHLIPACLLWLCLACGSFADEFTAKMGRQVKIPGQAGALWDISPENELTDATPFPDGSAVVFSSMQPGRYKITGWFIKDGKLGNVKHYITVIGSPPGPGPGPDPQPVVPYLDELKIAYEADKAASNASPEHLAALVTIWENAAVDLPNSRSTLYRAISLMYDRTLPVAALRKTRDTIAAILTRDLGKLTDQWSDAEKSQARVVLTNLAIALKQLDSGPGPGPQPDPNDPILKAILAAWASEQGAEKSQQTKKLAEVFRQSATEIKHASGRYLDFKNAMTEKRKNAIGEGLPLVRGVIATELDKVLPTKTDAVIDETGKQQCSAVFLRVAAALEALR